MKQWQYNESDIENLFEGNIEEGIFGRMMGKEMKFEDDGTEYILKLFPKVKNGTIGRVETKSGRTITSVDAEPDGDYTAFIVGSNNSNWLTKALHNNPKIDAKLKELAELQKDGVRDSRERWDKEDADEKEAKQRKYDDWKYSKAGQEATAKNVLQL